MSAFQHIPGCFRMFQDVGLKKHAKKSCFNKCKCNILKHPDNDVAIKGHIYGLQVFKSCAMIFYVSKAYLENADA